MQISPEVKQHIEAEEYEEVIRLLTPHAEQGDADAQFLLGYLQFTGAEVDPQWAKSWLEKAAAQNHAEACYELSRWINDNLFGPPENAANWALLFRAAELGCAQAQYALGAIYATGDCGLELDAAESRKWYGRAAAQGNIDSQYNLGLMWLDGEGGEIDIPRGICLLKQAAARDEPDAMSTFAADQLNRIYEQGLYGISPDSEAAKYWKMREKELDERPFRSHPDWFYWEKQIFVGMPDEIFLAKYELSPGEYRVLAMVDLAAGTLTPKQIPVNARGNIDDTISRESYKEAMERCLSKGWIKILSQVDCDADSRRWENDDNQFVSQFEYQVGNVDFVPERGILFGQIAAEWATRRGGKPYQGMRGYNTDKPNQFSVFSVYESELLPLAENPAKTNIEEAHWLGENIRLVSVEGPEQISDWWINRFVQLPIGYRVTFYTSEA